MVKEISWPSSLRVTKLEGRLPAGVGTIVPPQTSSATRASSRGAMTATIRRTLDVRRAMALAATLVCLLVVMLLASAVIKALTVRRQASRWDEQQLQCLFLIESAVDRSKARLAQDPDFAGESWTASMSERGETRSGIAEIRVERVPNESQLRRVEIVARWPDDPLMRVQRTKQLTITLASLGDSP